MHVTPSFLSFSESIICSLLIALCSDLDCSLWDILVDHGTVFPLQNQERNRYDRIPNHVGSQTHSAERSTGETSEGENA